MGNSDSARIASTILQQLGGNQFRVMTGVRDLVATGRGLRMRLPRNSSRVTHVHIELTPADTYDVTYLRRVGPVDSVVVAETAGIYFDMLAEDFERHTGLYTRL